MRIGVDLGGTKIEIAALRTGGEFALRERNASPIGDYDATVRAIRDLVFAAEAKLGQTCTVGVGIPGAISPATGLVKNANSTWINGKPLDRDLGNALNREVRLANDANCFALSEAADGAGKGKRVVFGVILGTGVGGGIVVDGRVLTGPNAIAGEWGHNPLPWAEPSETPGPACYCGKTGCIETWLSGPALSMQFAHGTGRKLDAERNRSARRQWRQPSEGNLRRLRAPPGQIARPPDQCPRPGHDRARRRSIEPRSSVHERPPLVADYAFSDKIATPIVKNRWGDSGGVRGAAWLWPG